MIKVNYIFFAFVLLSIVSCGNNTNTTENDDLNSSGTAQIVFREYEHHFGKVSEGEKISYQFIYENSGTGNLVLNSVTTTCGCTVPRYDKKPLKPGDTGSLEVVFDTSGRSGMQAKTITVNSNSSAPVVLLKITAEVEQI